MNLLKSQHKKLNKTIARHVPIKLLKITDRQKILAAARNKTRQYRDAKVRLTVDFLLETMLVKKIVD